MRTIVGLGNPGDEHARTRHNVGFAVVEELARRWGADFTRPRRGSRVARARFDGETVILVEPLTYMNCSGDALARLDADLRPLPAEMIVVHDDLDLACGRVAVKNGGGTGGHRGLASLIAWGGPEFVRVRVGIGRPSAEQDAVSFVLRPFRAEERSLIEDAIARAGDAVEAVLRQGVERAMNTFNTRQAEAPSDARSDSAGKSP
jgi:PTH1 family peptidyl-tRNA hydrolase